MSTDHDEEEEGEEVTPLVSGRQQGFSSYSAQSSFENSREESFHLGTTKMSKSNILTSMRFTESFMEYGDEYEKVPTQLTDNMHLLCDVNLLDDERGKFYLAEKSFNNPNVPPEYVLTVNPDIYFRILKEVHDYTALPWGLYFCCHDGNGLSSTEHVDIRVAYVLAGCIFLVMTVLTIVGNDG